MIPRPIHRPSRRRRGPSEEMGVGEDALFVGAEFAGILYEVAEDVLVGMNHAKNVNSKQPDMPCWWQVALADLARPVGEDRGAYCHPPPTPTDLLGRRIGLRLCCFVEIRSFINYCYEVGMVWET